MCQIQHEKKPVSNLKSKQSESFEQISMKCGDFRSIRMIYL